MDNGIYVRQGLTLKLMTGEQRRAAWSILESSLSAKGLDLSRSIMLADIELVSTGGDVRSRHRTGGHVNLGGISLGRKEYRKRDSEVVVRSDQRILRLITA